MNTIPTSMEPRASAVREAFRASPCGRVALLPGLFRTRAKLNRSYVMSLRSEDLLQNFYIEANLYETPSDAHQHWEPGHLGWESPACPLRGHFLGHWLSAAAKLYAAAGDAEAKAKADGIVKELGRCQVQNGGEWIGSIPEKYLHWIAEGKHVWAPQYTLHKTLMGLYDMYAFAGNAEALEIIDRWSGWFLRWTDGMSEEKLADILDVETGGMMEVWADVYGATGKPAHLELMRRYTRNRLFDPLLAGEDVLTNMHANTTIPEIHGAARAYEVTGEPRYRSIVEAYWASAVTTRGSYCTGSQTNGEVWSPPFELSARLGRRTQEHCVVYNMIRLADYLFRWTGDATYHDYIERNLYNGVLAQQHPKTGMITYFLPLHAGSKKAWGSPTKHFWCCHGSLVQAHTIYGSLAYYLAGGDELAVAQFIPSRFEWERDGGRVTIEQTTVSRTNWGVRKPEIDATRRPNALTVKIAVTVSEGAAEFALRVRLPAWLTGPATASVNGGPAAALAADAHGFASLRRTWNDGDAVELVLPRGLRTEALPDRPDTVAFLDGPIVLAGLCHEERTLIGDPAKPETILTPDNEREWASWLPGYRTIGQDRGMRFVPLYEIEDEPYTVYFPVTPAFTR